MTLRPAPASSTPHSTNAAASSAAQTAHSGHRDSITHRVSRSLNVEDRREPVSIEITHRGRGNQAREVRWSRDLQLTSGQGGSRLIYLLAVGQRMRQRPARHRPADGRVTVHMAAVQCHTRKLRRNNIYGPEVPEPKHYICPSQ